jgi:EpsI family protein
MLCALFFTLLNFALRWLPGKTASKAAGDRTTGGSPVRRSAAWTPAIAASAIILSAPLLANHFGQVPPVPLKKPLEQFPVSFQGRQGEKTEMSEAMWDRVGGQSYVMLNYSGDNASPVNFYVAFYEYQRKAGDFIHSPKLCLPGAGWYIHKNHVRTLPLGHGGPGDLDSLTFNELVISRDGSSQLVYFWYQGRGRNFTNEFVAKFYMVWDGIWRRRTDGALVRVILPMTEGQTLESARETLDPFAAAAAAELESFLP